MQTFLYFAYGSNMLTSRMRSRCPTAVLRTIAIARDHVVTFGKPSADKSGKATLRASSNPRSLACGVIFEISSKELRGLDRAEAGYIRREDFPVECMRSGETIQAYTYFSKEHNTELRPYDWYLALLLAGVQEHGLGDANGSIFRMIGWERDPEPDRQSRLEAIEALEEAGFADYVQLLSTPSR
jgi:gamma-glutamylcyclotransferase